METKLENLIKELSQEPTLKNNSFAILLSKMHEEKGIEECLDVFMEELNKLV